MSDFYQDALEAEAFGHDARPLCKRNSNPPSIYTAILLDLISHSFLYDATGYPLPYYGA